LLPRFAHLIVELNLGLKVSFHHISEVSTSLLVKVSHFTKSKGVNDVTALLDSHLLTRVRILFLQRYPESTLSQTGTHRHAQTRTRTHTHTHTHTIHAEQERLFSRSLLNKRQAFDVRFGFHPAVAKQSDWT
jgi:hypothetical protein